MEGEDGGTQVRRTARARKVNPRLFVGDDIDESYMKLVGRITASNYSGKNDKEGSSELSSDALSLDGRSDDTHIGHKEESSDQNIEGNKSIVKNTNFESGSFNIALKTVSLKKIKKNKKHSDSVGNENEPTDSKAAGSIIAHYRSSTESEASVELCESGMENKRKSSDLGENGQMKKIRIIYDNSTSDRITVSDKSEGRSSGSSIKTSVSASLPSLHETKVFSLQNNTNVNAFSSPVSVSPRTDIKNPFHSVLNPFVSIPKKLDAKQSKVMLTYSDKLNLPGKRLKILSLKPITTLKENLTPEGRASPILDNANKIVLGQDGPLELKIVKKDSLPLSVTNLPTVVSRTIPELKYEPKQQSVKVPVHSNDTAASTNLFSSDGEDDIPLKKLIKKKESSKKKKLLVKDIKLQKQKVKKDPASKINKTALKKKEKINQDDLPLKLLLKKKSKALMKMKSQHFASGSSGKKSKLAAFGNISKTPKIKKVSEMKKKKKAKIIEGDNNPTSNVQPSVKQKDSLSKSLQSSVKLKEGKPLKIKSKFKNLDSKPSSVKKKGGISLNNKKLNKEGFKKINKLRFKFPQKKIRKDVPSTDETKNINKLRFKFPQKKIKDVPIANETTNIVISVSGLEGDYACLAIDKDHISSQAENDQQPQKEKIDTAQIKTKKKAEEEAVPSMKKYTCNSGLVLEDVPVDSPKTKPVIPKDPKMIKKAKAAGEVKSDESILESFKTKMLPFKESKKFPDASLANSPKFKFKIPKELNKIPDVKSPAISDPITSKISKKESYETKETYRNNENLGQYSDVYVTKDSKVKDEFSDHKSNKTDSYSRFDSANKTDLEKDKSIKDAKKESGQVSPLEGKSKPKHTAEVKLEMDWKNREKERHKEEKGKKSEKHSYSEKVKSEKDSKKHKDKHSRSSEKKEKPLLDTTDKSIKKEKNESKVDLFVKTEKESIYKSVERDKNDPSTKRVEKENRVDSILKKEKELPKDDSPTAMPSPKVKKRENFEEALSNIPLVKPSRKTSGEGSKSHDKKVDKEEKRLAKEKRKDSKDFKHEITDDVGHSKEREYNRESSKSKNEEVKIKKEEKHRHKDERRHSSSGKSDERRKSHHDSSQSDKEYKRKRDEEKSRHSHHKKHKKDRSESRHQRSLSSSEERKLKHHARKEDRKDREDGSSSKYIQKNLVDGTQKDRLSIKSEDNKDLIINRMVSPQRETYEDTKDKKAASAQSLESKGIVKPEVIVDEEYLINSNMSAVKEESITANKQELLQPPTRLRVENEPITLKKEPEPLPNQAKKGVFETSTHQKTQHTELNQKQEEVELGHILNDVNNSQNRFVEEYYKNKENDSISDLGILEELKNFQERKERHDESIPLLDTECKGEKDDVQPKEERSVKSSLDLPKPMESDNNNAEISSIQTPFDQKLTLPDGEEKEIDKNLNQNEVHTLSIKETIDSSAESTSSNELFKGLKEISETKNKVSESDETTSLEVSKFRALQGESSKDSSEEVENGSLKKSTEETLKDILKTFSADTGKGVSEESSAENKAVLKESAFNENQKDKSKEFSRESSEETSKESVEESAIDSIKQLEKEIPKSSIKESFDDNVKESTEESSKDSSKESSAVSIKESAEKGLKYSIKEPSVEGLKEPAEIASLPKESLDEVSREVTMECDKDSYTKESPISSLDTKESSENSSKHQLKKEEKKPTEKENLNQSKKSKSKVGISMKDYLYRSVFQFVEPIETPDTETSDSVSETPSLPIPLSSIPLPGEPTPVTPKEPLSLVSYKDLKKRDESENKKAERRSESKKVYEPDLLTLPQPLIAKKTDYRTDTKKFESDETFMETDMDVAQPTPDQSPEQEENENNFESVPMEIEITSDEKENSPPEIDLNVQALQISPVKLPPKELTPKEREEKEKRDKEVVEERLKAYESLEENLYLVDRVRSKRSKEAKRMVCDCTLTKEEIANNEMGCGDECLNRLLLIECGSRCPLNDLCMNKRFQQKKYAGVEVFNADEKGCGVRACEEIPLGTFIMEYVGEVFDTKEFKRRRKEYAKGTSAHFYFMALRPDRLIDATRKGNISRFINHSCSPNAETQKWTVNGDIRIGFFATKTILPGEEINFDYRLERYGREPQRCFCGTPVCRGWLGEPPDQKTKEEKEEDRKREMRDRQKREGKRSFFEDMDLEDEIEKLTARGLRNRQDTLNLSRLMVRCEDSASRLSLLKILESGEEASKRLFLDYHGLKLLWSWMVDVSASHKCILLKMEILKTLNCLPITNKTQVTDSKIISVVERWSKAEDKSHKKEDNKSKIPKETTSTEKKMSDEDSDADASDAKDSDPPSSETVSPDDSSSQDSTEVSQKVEEEENSGESLSPEEASRSPSTPEDEVTVKELASRLLSVWSDLKEAFRIPKKERIEMMKEHEREVDNEYAKYLDKKTEGDRTQAFYDRWRYSSDKERERDRQRERERRRDKWRARRKDEEDDKGLSKEERRERFALQVAKEDEEARQRKLQEEMWKLHLERCALLGHDPYLTPIFDPSGQYYWDPAAKSWQAYVGPSGNLPVPASYGIIQQDAEALCPAMPVGQMFLPGAFYPLPHTPVSDGEGVVSETPDTDVPLSLDPSTIPLPGEQPPPKSPTSCTTPTATDVPPSVTIPLPAEEPQEMNGMETPPLASPGLVTITLPERWKMARDTERRIYFYHTRTRHTQWDLPTDDLHQELMTRYGITSDSDSDLESDSDSSSSSDSEDFSSDEEEIEEEENERPLVQQGEAVDEKMIRRPRGRRGHSEKLVQERVISPILFEDREAARRERKEAKERAREEARKERYLLLRTLRGGVVAVPKVEVETREEEEEAPSPPIDNEDDGEFSEEHLSKISRKQKSESKSTLKAKSKERAATAMADTSELARKIKDSFRARMATYIVSVLNPYRKPDCKEGRITSNDDFKYLARKLTHFVMVKELKQLPSIDGLECSESVKHKTKEFVRKYMSKYGDMFKRDPNDTKEY